MRDLEQKKRNTRELLAPADLARIANRALLSAKQLHDDLGEEGLAKNIVNQFGDPALRMDVEAEQAVLKMLRANNVPVEVISEEHGTTRISGNPRYRGMLDGIDGTGVYSSERGTGRYGTMIALYETLDASYDDYLYGGIMLHAQNQLYAVTRGQGSFVIEGDTRRQLTCSRRTELDAAARVHADTNFDAVYKTDVLTSLMQRFGPYTVTRSFAADFAGLVAGEIDAVIGFTGRKDDLEIAAAYPLLVEAGGVVVDIHGRPLGPQKHETLRKAPYMTFIAAGTRELAERIREKLVG